MCERPAAGLDYDHIWETVDTSVYTGGLHFLGLGHSFVKFPNTVQSIIYSEVCAVRSTTVIILCWH